MNTNQRIPENDVIELDLRELLRVVRQHAQAILFATVLGGCIAGAFSKLVLTPQYTSTAMVYVLSKETTLTSLADLQIGSQLTKDYAIIVTSRPVLEEVMEELNLEISYKEFKEKIQIDNPKDTRILSISATDSDPLMAKTIADEVASTSSEYIGDIMEMIPPKLIEDGAVPLLKTSPSNTRNAILGAALGFLLVCGVVVVEFILNDTIRTEDDVEKYLNLTVLASIPQREEENAEDKEAMAKNAAAGSLRSRKKRRAGKA